MSRNTTRTVWLLSAVLQISGCGKGSADDGSQPGVGPSNCPVREIPEAPAAAGLLVFSIPVEINPCSVAGFVVGYQDDLKVAMAQDGTYFITNVPGGAHDIIVTGQPAVASSLVEANKINAVRFDKVEFLNGVKKNKGKIELPPAGAITGVARLAGQSSHSGIHVYIPGTGYDATTDDSGNYTISSVPVGSNNLYLEKDGYHRGQVEGLSIASEKPTNAPEIALRLSTGAEGFLVIANGESISKSRTVSLSIGASKSAVLMKVGETDTFNNISWQPLVTSSSYTFSTPGEKTLFVKFSDANGLESSPFDDSISVDIFSDGSHAYQGDFSVASITPPADHFRLEDISIPENATAMIVSDNASFSGSTWTKPMTAATWLIKTDYFDCGSKTLYLKFKDKDDFESPPALEAANVLCWQNTASLGAPSQRGRHSAIWTGTEMIVWGGSVATADDCLNTGAAYNPITHVWRVLSGTSAPQARFGHSAIWTE